MLYNRRMEISLSLQKKNGNQSKEKDQYCLQKENGNQSFITKKWKSINGGISIRIDCSEGNKEMILYVKMLSSAQYRNSNEMKGIF